jgi:hypothetical protein
MIGEQLGFILSHSGHPQGSKRRYISIFIKGNTTPRRGWSGKDCARRKDIGILVPPTTNTLEKGKVKEEQGN